MTRARTPFAPFLTALLEDLRAGASKRLGMPGDARIIRLATEELMRMKAVVRAAEEWNPEHEHDRSGGNRRGCPGCRLDRALARLARGKAAKKGDAP
jgi:hypothetical protein